MVDVRNERALLSKHPQRFQWPRRRGEVRLAKPQGKQLFLFIALGVTTADKEELADVDVTVIWGGRRKSATIQNLGTVGAILLIHLEPEHTGMVEMTVITSRATSMCLTHRTLYGWDGVPELDFAQNWETIVT